MKSKIKKCPNCSSDAEARTHDYESESLDKESGKKIIVPNTKYYLCTAPGCKYSWMPPEEEEKIDAYIARNSRDRLTKELIGLFCKALRFKTKTQAARFLNLNSKAFVKWENNYSSPNDAYDLLLRLAVRSEDNFRFIQHMHATHFKYNAGDYELIRHHIQSEPMRLMPAEWKESKLPTGITTPGPQYQPTEFLKPVGNWDRKQKAEAAAEFA